MVIYKNLEGRLTFKPFDFIQLTFMLAAVLASYFIVVNRIERIEDAQVRHNESIKKHEEQLKVIEVQAAKINATLQPIKEDVSFIKNHLLNRHSVPNE